ncbi:MAG: hypothetical protein QOG23_1788 [Blastocatellia bacterium]|jgi:hypothetical protein|nr:hypothetical protein [Blastocatellia bacterium]
MLRRIGLSLGLLVSIVVMLPFATSTAHNLRSQMAARSHQFHHHSRAWWRRHRAQIRRRKAMLARRRALEANSLTTPANSRSTKSSDNHAALPGALAFPEGLYRDGAFSMSLPSGWSTGSTTRSASSFRIAPPDEAPEAQATLAVIALAPSNADQAIGREQRRMLGGVSFSDLRRSVIDKMISNGGWVVNDRQREIGGHRVFEVIAQTPATSDGKPEQLWNYYFTEINGRVYSLTTRTTGGLTQKIAGDAEKFLSDFRPTGTNK